MMNIETARFGLLEIAEDTILTFPNGLPGFEEETRYTLVAVDPSLPFHYLQALGNPQLAFLVADPFVFFKSYEFDLPQAVIEKLEITGAEDIRLWGIITAQESLQKATMNLLAPVVVNQSTHTGKQVVLHGTPYQTKHRLFSEGESR